MNGLLADLSGGLAGRVREMTSCSHETMNTRYEHMSKWTSWGNELGKQEHMEIQSCDRQSLAITTIYPKHLQSQSLSFHLFFFKTTSLLVFRGLYRRAQATSSYPNPNPTHQFPQLTQPRPRKPVSGRYTVESDVGILATIR